jgi:hypothetical protein
MRAKAVQNIAVSYWLERRPPICKQLTFNDVLMSHTACNNGNLVPVRATDGIAGMDHNWAKMVFQSAAKTLVDGPCVVTTA